MCFNIILPYKPRLSELSFPLRLPHQNVYALLLFPYYRTLRPSHSFLFDHSYIWLGLQIIKLLTTRPPPIPCYFVSLVLRTPFWNSPSLCSALNVCDQVSHPHTTTGRIIVPNGLICIFLYSKRGDERIWTKW